MLGCIIPLLRTWILLISRRVKACGAWWDVALFPPALPSLTPPAPSLTDLAAPWAWWASCLTVFALIAPSAWNIIPPDLHQTDSLTCFKPVLTSHFSARPDLTVMLIHDSCQQLPHRSLALPDLVHSIYYPLTSYIFDFMFIYCLTIPSGMSAPQGEGFFSFVHLYPKCQE